MEHRNRGQFAANPFAAFNVLKSELMLQYVCIYITRNISILYHNRGQFAAKPSTKYTNEPTFTCVCAKKCSSWKSKKALRCSGKFLHCNTLYCSIDAATHCNILQHTATHCNILQHTATHCNALCCSIDAATRCSTLQQIATHYNMKCTSQKSRKALRCANVYSATHYNTLQHTATYYNTLQHTATYYNTLQHTATRNAHRGNSK